MITIQQLHDFIELDVVKKTFNEQKYSQLQRMLGLPNEVLINEHLFTIGSLMERLTKHVQYINPMFYPKNWTGWYVDVVFQDGSRMQAEFPELIDGLWKAFVKMVDKIEG